MLWWKATGKVSWKGRVLSGEGGWGGPKSLGIYPWWGLVGLRRSCRGYVVFIVWMVVLR